MLFPTLDQQSKALINKARHLGGSGPTVNLENHELLRLCAIVAADLNQTHLTKEFINNENLANGYYSIPLEWFNQPLSQAIDFVETFLLLKSQIEDFETYFANFCEIHK